MKGPFNEVEEEELERLEQELLQARVSFGATMKMYAEFLLTLLRKEQCHSDAVPLSDASILTAGLQLAATGVGDQSLEEARRHWRVECWSLYDSLSKSHLEQANFVRCAVCCFYPEDEWNPDTQEDLTAIPLFFALLKKFDSAIGTDFLEFARRRLLES